MEIIFATSNKDKLKEAREILGVDIVGTDLDIDEVQSLDPIEVTKKKAHEYYVQLKKPLFVEDVSLTFKFFKRLPGTYINDFYNVLGNNGLVQLLKNTKVRDAVAQTTVVFIDERGQDHVFVGKIGGTISKTPVGDKGFGWDPIFIPKGEKKTFGQMSLEEKNKYSMRAKALKSFKKWLNSSK